MFFYKLRKILRNSWLEILRSSVILSFIGSFVPFFPFLFLYNDDFTRRDRIQMFTVSAICIIINLFMIYYVEKIFGFNIIFSIFLGNLFSFCLYLIPCILFIMSFEFSELQLDKSEIRDAKLDSLFRKLF